MTLLLLQSSSSTSSFWTNGKYPGVLSIVAIVVGGLLVIAALCALIFASMCGGTSSVVSKQPDATIPQYASVVAAEPSKEVEMYQSDRIEEV